MSGDCAPASGVERPVWEGTVEARCLRRTNSLSDADESAEMSQTISSSESSELEGNNCSEAIDPERERLDTRSYSENEEESVGEVRGLAAIAAEWHRCATKTESNQRAARDVKVRC